MVSRKNLHQNQSGQGTIEYILLLIFVLGIASALSRGIQVIWNKNVLTVGGRVEQALKTGRTPNSAWKN